MNKNANAYNFLQKRAKWNKVLNLNFLKFTLKKLVINKITFYTHWAFDFFAKITLLKKNAFIFVTFLN